MKPKKLKSIIVQIALTIVFSLIVSKTLANQENEKYYKSDIYIHTGTGDSEWGVFDPEHAPNPETTMSTMGLKLSIDIDYDSLEKLDFIEADTGTSTYHLAHNSPLWTALTAFCGEQTSYYCVDQYNNSGDDQYFSITNDSDSHIWETFCETFYFLFDGDDGDTLKVCLVTPIKTIEFKYKDNNKIPFNTAGPFQPRKISGKNNYIWVDYNSSSFYLLQQNESHEGMIKYPFFQGTIAMNDSGSYIGTVYSPFLPASGQQTMNITVDAGGYQALVLGKNYTGTTNTQPSDGAGDCADYFDDTSENSIIEFGNGSIGVIKNYPNQMDQTPILFPSASVNLGCEIEDGSNPDRVFNYLGLRINAPWQELFKSYYIEHVASDVNNYKWFTAGFGFASDPSENTIEFGWGLPDEINTP